MKIFKEAACFYFPREIGGFFYVQERGDDMTNNLNNN